MDGLSTHPVPVRSQWSRQLEVHLRDRHLRAGAATELDYYGSPRTYTFGMGESLEAWTDPQAALIERMQDAIVGELRRQDAAAPGFSTDRTADPNLFAVHGILTVDGLAHAAVKVITEWIGSPASTVSTGGTGGGVCGYRPPNPY